MLDNITGITVCHNTYDLFKRAYESVRRFHPDMKILVVDGSAEGNPCREYARGLASSVTDVYLAQGNIGHGRGMAFALDLVQTQFAFIFDSDIEMIKSPLEGMLSWMDANTYGVGLIEPTGLDGYEYGAHAHHPGEPVIAYLHPFFQLISVEMYRKFHPYVHHGAPCYLAMLELHKKGLGHMVKQYPGIHHTAGKGWNWEGKPSEYLVHNIAGTRHVRTQAGLPEIEEGWILKGINDL